MNVLLDGHWPWWIGGPAFALLVVGMWAIERRLLGVSGTYTALVTPHDASDTALEEMGDAELEAAMMRATLAEFGEEELAAFEADLAAQASADEASPLRPREPLPRSAHLAFLFMLVVGGALGAAAAGTWAPRASLGHLHTMFFGRGAGAWLVLVLGGVAVGFGTRMAGGCTTGHGFSGSSRLQIGSLASTAAFFGTAVGVSFALRMLLP